MVNVDTRTLRIAADQLGKNAVRYNNRITKLENCIFEIRNQKFSEKEQILHKLNIQKDELYQQRQQMRMLSETLNNICKHYDNSEKQIQEYQRYGRKVGYINTVNLKQVREYLHALGMQIEDL